MPTQLHLQEHGRDSSASVCVKHCCQSSKSNPLNHTSLTGSHKLLEGENWHGSPTINLRYTFFWFLLFDLKNNYVENQWQTAFVLTLRCVDVRASFSLANLGVFFVFRDLWALVFSAVIESCTARALHRCPTQQNLDFGSHTPH